MGNEFKTMDGVNSGYQVDKGWSDPYNGGVSDTSDMSNSSAGFKELSDGMEVKGNDDPMADLRAQAKKQDAAEFGTPASTTPPVATATAPPPPVRSYPKGTTNLADQVENMKGAKARDILLKGFEEIDNTLESKGLLSSGVKVAGGGTIGAGLGYAGGKSQGLKDLDEEKRRAYNEGVNDTLLKKRGQTAHDKRSPKDFKFDLKVPSTKTKGAGTKYLSEMALPHAGLAAGTGFLTGAVVGEKRGKRPEYWKDEEGKPSNPLAEGYKKGRKYAKDRIEQGKTPDVETKGVGKEVALGVGLPLAAGVAASVPGYRGGKKRIKKVEDGADAYGKRMGIRDAITEEGARHIREREEKLGRPIEALKELNDSMIIKGRSGGITLSPGAPTQAVEDKIYRQRAESNARNLADVSAKRGEELNKVKPALADAHKYINNQERSLAKQADKIAGQASKLRKGKIAAAIGVPLAVASAYKLGGKNTEEKGWFSSPKNEEEMWNHHFKKIKRSHYDSETGTKLIRPTKYIEPGGPEGQGQVKEKYKQRMENKGAADELLSKVGRSIKAGTESIGSFAGENVSRAGGKLKNKARTKTGYDVADKIHSAGAAMQRNPLTTGIGATVAGNIALNRAINGKGFETEEKGDVINFPGKIVRTGRKINRATEGGLEKIGGAIKKVGQRVVEAHKKPFQAGLTGAAIGTAIQVPAARHDVKVALEKERANKGFENIDESLVTKGKNILGKPAERLWNIDSAGKLTKFPAQEELFNLRKQAIPKWRGGQKPIETIKVGKSEKGWVGNKIGQATKPLIDEAKAEMAKHAGDIKGEIAKQGKRAVIAAGVGTGAGAGIGSGVGTYAANKKRVDKGVGNTFDVVVKSEDKGRKSDEKDKEDKPKIYDPQDGPGLDRLRGKIRTVGISSDVIEEKGIIGDISKKLKKKPVSPFEGSVMQERQNAGRHLKKNLTKEGQARQEKYDDILSTTQEFNARQGIKGFDGIEEKKMNMDMPPLQQKYSRGPAKFSTGKTVRVKGLIEPNDPSVSPEMKQRLKLYSRARKIGIIPHTSVSVDEGGKSYRLPDED